MDQIESNSFLTFVHQTTYKTFFGLIGNNSEWFGNRFRNDLFVLIVSGVESYVRNYI